MKKTIVVNLFAGPGAGKSTGAAYVFSQLKMRGIDCELVTEFAKDKVWEDNKEVFKCQFYVTGKQVFKVSRCYGKVDVIVTDSPIAIGAQYCDDEILKAAIYNEFGKYNNVNYFIRRVKGYNPNGRNQTFEESCAIDENILNWLKESNIEFTNVRGDEIGYGVIVDEIVKALNTQKSE